MTLKRLPTQFLILFVLSGIAGLVHETVWARYLGIILGHSAYGQILTLVVYMGGIGLGSALAGRLVHRFKNPLMAYVLVELGIGIGGFVFHHEFLLLRGWLLDSGILVGTSELTATLASVGVGVALTLPFALMIGMTYPLATAFFIRLQKDGGEDSVARLYFGNSLGAAFGAVLNSYFLIPQLGTAGALVVAGILNTSIAGMAWLAHRRSGKAAPDTVAAPSSTISQPPLPSGAPRLLLASALVTGLSSFFYEIGWIRYLSFLLGSSSHAFDLMVSSFVLGLAGGALTIHKNPHWNLIKTLVSAQILMAATAVLGVVAYEPIFRGANSLNLVYQRTAQAYPYVTFARYLFCLAVMLPAAWFAGMTLPIICRILLESGRGESFTGKVYALNTLGAILGAAAGGLIFLPLLGPFHLVSLGAAIDLGLATLLVFKLMPLRSRSILSLASISFALVSWSLALEPKNHVVAAGVFRGYSKFRTHLSDSLIHGRTSSIYVAKDSDQQVTLSTNGKPDASFFLSGPRPGPTDAMTQSMLGWIGRAYAGDNFRAAMIGMGSGQTANVVLQDSRCSSLDLIEIEPAVYELAKWFQPANNLVYTDPRIELHYQDARTFFARQKALYDLIISEPSNPWVSGVSSLFTDEFYGEMKTRMSPSGVLVQWFHTYETSDTIVLSILKTIRKNFSSVMVLSLPNPYDFYIIASSSPFRKPVLTGIIDSAYLQINMMSRADLSGAMEILHNDAIDIATEGATVNSEFNPFVDVQAERAFFLQSRSGLIWELEMGSISLDVISRQQVPADILHARARRSLLARSFRLEEKFNNLDAQVLRSAKMTLESQNFAFRQFRTTLPSWTWAIPKVGALVDTFRSRIDSIGNSSNESALFHWAWYVNRIQHDSAMKYLGRSFNGLPYDLSLDNLRDIYAYLILSEDFPRARTLRQAAQAKFPNGVIRADFQILDRLMLRKAGFSRTSS